jgi:serine/threonine protein phosphatase 1
MTEFNSEIGPWRPLPNTGPDAQIFAIGDVHGQAKTLAAVLDAIGAVPRRAAQRRLIFLGDLIDRGPESLTAIGHVATAKARARVDDVIILPGNHELMLLDALDDPMMFMGDWLDNGGDALILEALPNFNVTRLADFADIARAAIPGWFLEQMRTGPTWHLEGALLFVHAGLDPNAEPEEFLARGRLGVYGSEHWAWIRGPFLDWSGGWGPQAQWQVIHGHTPAVRVLTKLEQFALAADHLVTHGRLCLDAGSAFDLPQIAWAEFCQGRFRLGMIRHEMG